MGTFNVSLKTLTERVSLEVVYTPKELDQINVEIAEVNVRVCFWPDTMTILINSVCRSWVWQR